MPTNEEIRAELEYKVRNSGDCLRLGPGCFFNESMEQKITVLCEFLSQNTTIKILDLSESLQVQEMKAIAEALKVNKSIECLMLDYSMCGLEGVKAIAEALKVSKTITGIYSGGLGDLEKNTERSEKIKALAEVLKTNKLIKYTNVYINNEESIQPILEAFEINKSITSVFNGYFSTGDPARAQQVRAKIMSLTEQNKLFLHTAIAQLKTKGILDADEIYTLRAHLKDEMLNPDFKYYTAEDLANCANNLRDSLNTLQNHFVEKYWEELQLMPMAKALAKFNGCGTKGPGFLYKVGEYLEAADLASFIEAFPKPKNVLLDASAKFTDLDDSLGRDLLVFEDSATFSGANDFLGGGVKDIAYQANLGIKALDTAVDTLRLVYAPSVENLYTVVKDVNHLFSMCYGGNIYSYAIMASSVLAKAYEGKWYEVAQETALSASFLLESNEIIAGILPAALMIYGAYHVGANAYDLYQEIFLPPNESTVVGAIYNIFEL
jgi:uncharacterized protein YacL (UPF0231 family)